MTSASNQSATGPNRPAGRRNSTIAAASNATLAARLGTNSDVSIEPDRTVSGPINCPSADAAVIAATTRDVAAPATSRASWNAAIVTTTKLPPTHSALIRIVASPGASAGAAMPAAVSSVPSATSRRGGTPFRRLAANSVDSPAAAPNAGHAQPNTSGSGSNWRPSAGRNVAGMI